MNELKDQTVSFENIPKEMQEIPNWLVWKYNIKNGKATKVPYSIKTNKPADPNNKVNQHKFEELTNESVNYDGIGFVFDGKGIFGVDVDSNDIEDMKDFMSGGKDNPFYEFYQLGTYCEISPSGKGMHFYFKGDLPDKSFKNSKTGVEMYSKNRYFTVTGNSVNPEFNKVIDGTEIIKPLYEKHKTHKEVSSNNSLIIQDKGNDIEIDDLIHKIMNSKGKEKFYSLFYEGDTNEYGNDDSSADQALANILMWWTNHDLEKANLMFKQSALYRDKWDSRRGNSTYGMNTLLEASRIVTGGYNGLQLQNRITFKDFELLKSLTVKDYEKHIQLIKNRAGKGLTLNDSQTTDYDENGILWVWKSEDEVYPIGNYLNSEKMWDLFVDMFYNEFSERDEIFDFRTKKVRDYSDNDDKEIFKLIAEIYGVEIKKKYWSEIPHNIAKKRSYNPLKLRVEQQIWDGTPRVENYFIDLLGCEDSEYTKEVTKIWFTGLINRIYDPGCKFEIVPILTGEQGIGKSTACSILLPDYFTDSLKGFGNTKDDYQLLESVAVVELSELKSLKKSEMADVKSFISARYDDIRRSYGRRTVKIPRHCVFIGTSNPDDFLKDETGERRFYPMKVKQQAPKIHPMEVSEDYILQVLAEAKVFYDNKEPLILSKETIAVSKIVQEQHKVQDPAKEAILNYLDMKVPNEWYEMNQIEKQIHYRYYYNLPIDFNDQRYKTFSPESCTNEIDKTSVNEIAFIVFGHDPIKSGSKIGVHGKIRSVLDNLDNWERKRVKLEKFSNPIQGYTKILSVLSEDCQFS